MKLLIILLISTVVLQYGNCYLFPIEARLPLKGEVPAPGSPWPLPQRWSKSHEILTIDPTKFYFETNAGLCDVMRNAMKRYRDLIFVDQKGVKAANTDVLDYAYIEIENYHECGYPRHDDDEKYNITVSFVSPATIHAKTVWGALRGLETFSQLVYEKEKTKEYFINVTHISDWPRYKFRAMHLDTARHFIPKKLIFADLDAMAYNKFNVFHWHIIDDQSFPFESKQYPELSAKSAYTPKHIYTQKDVSDVIEYARMRGIRVIPEIDTPGHTQAIGKAFPDLLTPCYGQGESKPFTPNYPEHSPSEMLNPMKNQTYAFMKELFREFKHVFKDDYIHLGMDEVYYACWNSSPEVAQFMRANNLTKISEFEEYYVKKTIQNVKDIGYKYMMWQDPADNGVKLADDSIVVVWKDKYLDPSMDYWQNYIAKVAKEGYELVLSACWYLNYIETPYPGRDWEKLYTCDPRHFNGTDAEKDLVIGGEVCMWTEFVDGTNLLSRLWPRASSVAERLWSDANATQDVDTARHRLDQMRCRMLRRGIPAAPILNGYCGDYEWDMNDNNMPVDLGDRVRLQ